MEEEIEEGFGTSEDPQKAENLRELFEQHWLQCRHLENERTWFLVQYVVVTGGGLAYTAGERSTPSPVLYFLLAFIVVLTFVGFFVSLRWIYAFECHREKVNILAEILWAESRANSALDPTMNIAPIDVVPESIKGRKTSKRFREVINEVFRTRYWFPLFYFIILILLGYAIFFLLDYSPALSKGIAIAAFALACILGVRWCSSLRKIERGNVLLGSSLTHHESSRQGIEVAPSHC